MYDEHLEGETEDVAKQSKTFDVTPDGGPVYSQEAMFSPSGRYFQVHNLNLY